MKILLSNDDGVLAEGLACMHKHLAEKHDVTVIAPDRNCSGMSNALSLHSPLRVTTMENGFHAVNGTPSDCVQLGVNSGFFDEPDLVVSGINHGPNLGDDTIYSGTVAAALEGRHCGHPALAVSICSKKNQKFDTAALLAVEIIDKMNEIPLDSNQILNINVPDIHHDEIQGIQVTRCGKRHRAETMVTDRDPFGNQIFWYGKLGKELDAGEGTDFHAVANGYCSVSPIYTDMTVHQQVNNLKEWFKSH